MAKFKSSTFGKISGKHGDVVAVTMKDGTSYFRAHIIPPNPNTLKQQSQRAKFGFAVRELNCMRPLFTVTFGGQYGTNRAVSLAMKTCVSGEYPDFRIDYNLLQLAVGNLAIPATHNLQQQADKEHKLTWSYNAEFLAENPDDELSIVLFNNNLKQISHLQNNALRSSRAVEFALPDYWLCSDTHAWFYFSSENNPAFSNSIYLGLLLNFRICSSLNIIQNTMVR